MKKRKKIRITVSFEAPEDVWLRLPADLRDKGLMAKVGVYGLTPADLVAFAVLNASLVGGV